MKILLIGGSSFIGKNFILNCPKNWELTATYYKSLDFLKLTKHKKNIKVINFDLKKKKFPKFDSYDVVLYLPTITPGLLKFNTNIDKDLMYYLHVYVLEKLIKNINKINLFIYFSSGIFYLYDNFSIYRQSKIIGEANVQSLSKKYNFKYLILRNMETFGPHMSEHKLYKRIFIACNQNDKKMKIFGDGNNFLDTMYIDEYIDILINLIRNRVKNKILSFSKSQPYKLKSILKIFSNIFNSSIQFEFSGDPTEYIDYKLNNDELLNLSKYSFKMNLKESLKQWIIAENQLITKK